MHYSTGEEFLRSIQVSIEKGRGGPPIAKQRESKAEEALVELLKRNETLTAESLTLWEQKLLQDPLLSDVPANASLEDIEALLARELGTGLTVILVRMDGERIPITVPPTTTVRDLKLRIKSVLSARYEHPARMGTRRISWKGVWEGFCLAFGLSNDAEVNFARYNAKKAVKDARPKREKRPRKNTGE